jgi:hypothetical protein
MSQTISLRLHVAPYWLDLMPGVRLHVKPYGRTLQSEVMTVLGDAPDPGAFVSETAERAILNWEGIGDPDGNPLPCNADNVAALLDDPRAFAAFQEAYLAPAFEVEEEGNG